MKFLVSSLVAASVASAATIQIKVGPTLTFDPDDVKAAVGDTLEFHYYAQSHSVASSDFATPCKLNNRFFSGYYPATGDAANPNVFRVSVNDTQPIWFYCSRATHCANGMVGVVNAPANSNKTLDAYKTAAKQFSGTAGDATAAFGGVNATATSSTSGSTTSSGTSSSASASGSSAASGFKVATGGLLGVVGVAIFGMM